ncbi:MAG: GNAT family N-acetyltransferase [Paludisphaera borealis]|uniref:GNAT family N-acetyltransferase n=1 Tax=Paludisphaera borealis TaxID=1387353 RepID=UPI00284ED408|nr:GNAT family N-acetyltransferase [Paludisphaera borealis]MDR3623114.1 GNAT family N-acetyltransferase [Paludisphaera borealis]
MAARTILLADHALARRIEAAWDRVGVENARSALRRRPDCGAEILAVGEGHAVYLGAGSPLSQAQGIGLNGPVAESDVARMEAFFLDRATPCQIEVASTADPSFPTLLSARGFAILELTHMLALPLAGWTPPDRSGEGAGPEVVVERVEADRIEAWVDVVLGGFFDGDEPPAALREGAIAMAMIQGVTAWQAKVDGRPAGGASLLVIDGLGLMAGDGTLAEFRGRGVQTALLSARLAHARDAGCDLAVTCTQPATGSQRNAERLGFQIVYARAMLTRG